MASNRPNLDRRSAVAALLGLAALASGSPLWAQDHTGDPYKPYNSAYEQFVYPVYPSGSGYVPNQGVLEGRGGYSAANRFQDYINSGDVGLGDAGYSPRRTGPGVPYYSAHRQYQRERENPYQARDQEFYKDQQARQEKFMAYLRERDPKKRAQLYRDYQAASQKVTRELSSPRSALGSSPATRRPAAAAAAAPAGRSAPATGSTRPGTAGAARTPAAGATAPTLRSSPPPPPSTSTRTARPSTRPSDILRRAIDEEAQKRAGTSRTPSTPPGPPPAPPR